MELGADNYSSTIRINGHPAAGIGIYLDPGANALSTSRLVKGYMAKAASRLPNGYRIAYANDSSDFIRLSVTEVVKTLAEAMVLVIIVMFVFLQSWRATLIPGIAIPVVLLGTFAMLYILGFSINTLTLFGLVLAVGLLVDDAIVVVENVERILQEQPELTTKEATIVSMEQIQMALVAIALVLSAVFLPMVFFGGSTGVIYRQFSATIVSAMGLSVLLALTFSPSLAANVLRRQHGNVEETWLGKRAPRIAHGIETGRQKFNSGFDRSINWYVGTVGRVVDRKWLFLLIYAAVCILLVILYSRIPTGFIPTEDQGNASVQFRLPAGRHSAELRRWNGLSKNISCRVLSTRTSACSSELPEAEAVFRVRIPAKPTSTSRRSTNVDRRKIARQRSSLAHPTPSEIFAMRRFLLSSRSIRGLGQSTGFTMELQNTSGMTRTQFAAARDRLSAAAAADPNLNQVRLAELPDVSSLKVNIDQQQVAAFGLSPTNVNSTLSTAWGGQYVNDFIDRGQVNESMSRAMRNSARNLRISAPVCPQTTREEWSRSHPSQRANGPLHRSRSIGSRDTRPMNRRRFRGG